MSREYYTRKKKPGIYKITRYKKCGGKQNNEFIITDPDINELTFNIEWAENNSIRTDKSTGQILITCPNQYFKLLDELEARGFNEEDIDFFISKVAYFKNLTSSKCLDE